METTTLPDMSRIESRVREAVRRRDERLFVRAVYDYDVALTALREILYETGTNDTPGEDGPYMRRMQKFALAALLASWTDGQKLTGDVKDIWRDPERLAALQSSIRHASVAVLYLQPMEADVPIAV